MELEAGGGDEAAFHAARGADEEDIGVEAGDQFARDGKSRNDVAAGASAGDQNAEIGHLGAALISFLRHGFMERSVGRAKRTLLRG